MCYGGQKILWDCHCSGFESKLGIVLGNGGRVLGMIFVSLIKDIVSQVITQKNSY